MRRSAVILTPIFSKVSCGRSPRKSLNGLFMARYFKYKAVEDIRRDAERLKLPIEFSEDLAPLTNPVAIGPLRAGNSIAIQPMEGCDGTLEGDPDELTFRRYRRFGACGAKIVWGEATAVVEDA